MAAKEQPKDSKKDDKQPAPEKKAKNVKLPVLWETVNTFSQLIVTLLGLAVAVVSYINGSGFLMSAVRAGAAMLGVGLVLWLIYWMVARGSLDLMYSLYKERQSELGGQPGRNSTLEFHG